MLVLVVGACSAAPVAPPGGVRSPVAWEDWRPVEPVRDLPRLADSDKLVMRKEHLASLAASYGIDDPPEVELERWIYPTEHGPTQKECFAEAGFEVESGPEGEGVRVVGPVNDAQAPLLNLAHYTCTARFYIDPDFMQFPTTDQIRVSYEYMTEVLIPCLKEQGYDPSDPPALETYIASYGGAQWWSPYAAAGIHSGMAEYENLTQGVCRGDPPAAARYGERLR